MSYPVMEHFYTIQGEGAYSGHAAYFIRLAGCDVGCIWCDVKESWDSAEHPLMSADELLQNIQKTAAKIVVITGGEPLMHDLNVLTNLLKENDYRLHIETSGTQPLSGKFDWICFSPKRFKKPLIEFYECANELKIIIAHRNDFRFAEEQAALLKKANCKLLLQAEWYRRNEIYPLLVEYIKQHPQWQVSVQTHKYLNVP